MIRSASTRLISLKNMSTYVAKDRLKEKVAIVTASTAGIGLATARRLAQEGAKVVISSRKEKNVKETVSALTSEGLTVTGLVCHVANAEYRKKLYNEAVSKYGGIDILVSNAAINPVMGPIFDCDEKAWDKIFEVNVKAAFLLSKEVIPFMKKRGGGRIIYMSSIGGLQPFNLLGAYSASKTALIGLMKAAAQNLVDDNITANAVAPGIIRTKFSAALHESKEVAEISLSQIPMKRFGETNEVAATVAFLASDDAKYITGETLVVAGGMQSRL